MKSKLLIVLSVSLTSLSKKVKKYSIKVINASPSIKISNRISISEFQPESAIYGFQFPPQNALFAAVEFLTGSVGDALEEAVDRGKHAYKKTRMFMFDLVRKKNPRTFHRCSYDHDTL
jgi:hypothetical protein